MHTYLVQKLREKTNQSCCGRPRTGFVTDDIIKQKELKLRQALKSDPKVNLKEAAQPEVAQVTELVAWAILTCFETTFCDQKSCVTVEATSPQM